MALKWVHQCMLIIRKKYKLIFGKGPTQGLDDTTLTAEKVHVYGFSVDYDSADVADILDIHRYLMFKNNKK